ncbi:MAG: hypothetical protein AB7E09_03775 [Candidatus Izemoplasmatales bacterium]|uniref:Uncharacterized protein n=1 Tax=Hujiaoplasma nucleasis TaxID=2725268 RepID=A0A7L6N401_9MOLU|nr:hypothetical protein [Hujiaoplasma nucleasis]QLY40903.1 hypothetical protein HF295_08555 [Hujiaoplasma nucleasis]
MALDDNKGTTYNQTRISNSDRHHSTRYNAIDKGQDEDLKRFEAMNRRNWISVITFIGIIVAIILFFIIKSFL